LPEKRIKKSKRIAFWGTKQEPWSEGSSMANVVDPIIEDTPDIDLKMSITKHYTDEHLNPTRSDNVLMRRMQCSVERLDFEEIQYTLGDTYMNERDPSRGIHISFWKKIAAKHIFPSPIYAFSFALMHYRKKLSLMKTRSCADFHRLGFFPVIRTSF
jgi:hypothetical protein